VLKVQKAEMAKIEFTAMQRLHGIVGVPQLKIDHVFDVGVDGATLTGLLSGPVGVVPTPTSMSPDVAAALANILVSAADLDVLHGDVSPDNIIIAKEQPFLIDWGSASSSEGAFFQGTFFLFQLCVLTVCPYSLCIL
jgi:RIO-like serine/threonine protein kinase